jgi:transcriptional regulator GlxA family with amidase domain
MTPLSGHSSFPAAPEGRAAEVTVLLLDEFSLMSLAATVEPLRAANRVAAHELYRWRLVSHDGSAMRTSSGIPVQMHAAFDPDSPCDLLIIVAAFNADRQAPPLLRPLRRVARRGVPLIGIESGSWVLGRAGLLDGHRATTHWEDLEEFAAAFPEVEVVADRYVADRNRFTAAGAAPALDMILAMLRAQHGLAIALDVASVFIYDQRQTADDPQKIVALGRLAGLRPKLAAAIRCMQDHIEQPLPIEAVARRSGVSLRLLQIHFRKELGMSPHSYYLELRLAAARRMLQQTNHSATMVAMAHGFSSGSALARAFRARYGVSPLDARALATSPAPSQLPATAKPAVLASSSRV